MQQSNMQQRLACLHPPVNRPVTFLSKPDRAFVSASITCNQFCMALPGLGDRWEQKYLSGLGDTWEQKYLSGMGDTWEQKYYKAPF